MTKLLDNQDDFHKSVEAIMAVDKACKGLIGSGKCPCPICGGTISWWKDSRRSVRARCDRCGFRAIG